MDNNGLHVLSNIDERTGKPKIILDLCGGTGSWSKPYKEAGYDVRVITLPEYDVCTYIPPENVYGVLAATPCDEFSIAKHFHGKGKYTHNFKAGLEVCSACCRIILFSKPVFWAIENPANGLLKKWLGEPDYVFSPWQFGHPYQKKTALWGVLSTPRKRNRKAGGNEEIFRAFKQRDLPGILRNLYTTRTACDYAAEFRKSIF